MPTNGKSLNSSRNVATCEVVMPAGSGVPVPGGSVIYVYRNESLGAALSMPVTLNGKLAGTTGARSYLRLEVPAGTHNLASQGDGSKLTVTTEPGKVYYVWQEVKMGLVSGGSKLQIVPEDVGKKGVMESALIQAAK